VPGDETTATEDAKPASVPKNPRRRKRYRELGLTVAGVIVLTLVLKAFVIQVYEIPSPSMTNTLMVNDRVLVNKLVYHTRSVARGDIIVFSGAGSWGDLNGNPIPPPPGNPVEHFFDAMLADLGFHGNNTFYIKRVIGLPGDHVACCTDGMVTVNGVPLHESSYLYPGTNPAAPSPFSIVVPAGRLWVMGDNRDDSADSLWHYQHGSTLIASTIPENEVAGRAFFVLWPLSQFGDLPIPATFKQAGVDATPASAATILTAPVLLWRRRKRTRGGRGRI
jgi:signal peptidase I